MYYNIFKYLSLRYLTTHPLRSLLTFLGVSFGISLYLSTVLINSSTNSTFVQNVNALTGSADLTITADAMGFDEKIAEMVSKLPGIKSATPMIINYAFLKNEDNAGHKYVAIMFLGVDLLKESNVRGYQGDEQVIEDPLLFINQPDSLIVTKKFLQKFHKKMDESIPLISSKGLRNFVIRGKMDDVGPAKAFDGTMAIMDIDAARYNFGREGKIDRLDIVVKNKAEVKSMKALLLKTLGDQFHVEDKEEQTSSALQLINSLQQITNFLGIISFLVAFFIIVNIVTMAVSQRKKEFGVLRALGAQRKQLLFLIFAEFVSLGLLSALFGSLLAYLIASYSIQDVVRSLAAQTLSIFPYVKVEFHLTHLWTALQLGFISSFVAILYPSYKAMRIHPAQSLRPVQVDLTAAGGYRFWNIVGLFGATLLGLVIILAPTVTTKGAQQYFIAGGMLSAVTFVPYLSLRILHLLSLLPLPYTMSFPIANLLRSPVRTMNNMLNLVVGFILVVLVSSIKLSFHHTIIDWANQISSQNKSLIVSTYGNMSALQIQPIHEDLVDTVYKEIPDIQKYSTIKPLGVRFVHLFYADKKIMLKAFDYGGPNFEPHYIYPISESRNSLSEKLYNPNEPSVLLSESFVRTTGKKVGDYLELKSPQGIKKFYVAGIIRDFANSNGVIYMWRQWYRDYWNDHLLSVFSIYFKNISIKDMEKLIQDDLESKFHLILTESNEITKNIAHTIESSTQMTDTVKWVSLIIGMLGLLNALLISTIERFREIGGLRSIGMTQGQLLQMILMESFLMGVVTVIVSFSFAIILSYIFINWTLGYMLGWKVDFYYSSFDLSVLFIFGFCITIIAGIYPAYKASQLKIRDALEYE